MNTYLSTYILQLITAVFRAKLLAAVEHVSALAASEIEIFKFVTDKLAGIEIIHLFISDLLGRKTAAAKIFEETINEDLKRT